MLLNSFDNGFNNKIKFQDTSTSKQNKICVLMYYDECISCHGDINYEINKEYCKKYNIDIICSNETTYSDRHPAWERVPLIIKYIENYDYVIWIDADAYFYIDSENINEFINKNLDYNFIFSGDINGKTNEEINTGFFIVKNTKNSISFLKEWAFNNDLYNQNPVPGWWDQGLLRYMYSKNMLSIQTNSIVIPYGILQHFKFNDDELNILKTKPFVHHVAGRDTDIRYITSFDYYNKIKINMKTVSYFYNKQSISNEYKNITKLREQYLNDIKEIVINSNSLLEGNCFYFHESLYPMNDYLNKQINLFWAGKQGNTRICEIGFNAGHSTLLMLLGRNKTPINYTIFDIGIHPYVKPCFNYIKKEFPHIVFEYIEGDSTIEMPKWIDNNINLIEKYDIIHIDGGHTDHCISNDMMNADKLLKLNGIIIVDDTNSEIINKYVNTYISSGCYKEINILKTFMCTHRMIQKIISNNNENIKLEISKENIESVVDNTYNLTIMAIFKNETMNLKMWLDHYLWQGVEHFYLIDNGSTDNPYDILQEYIDKCIVTYYYRAEKHQQVQHYRYVFDNEKLKEKTKWLCICDLDEFFFGTEQKLVTAMEEFNEYNVIYTNSFFYGSDNLINHPRDIRTSIIHREEDILNGTKYIFKPSCINNSSEIWIHWLVKEGTLEKKHMNEITQNNKIRLNHYRIQSFEYYKNVKMTRGDVSTQANEIIRDIKYFENYTNVSTIKDDILKEIIENGYNYENNVNSEPNTAVIVEPRFLKHLPFVINDYYKKLGKGWKIVFYCGVGLKNIWIDLLNNPEIEIRELNNNYFKYNQYCDFIKSKDFWSSLYGKYVLLFTINSSIFNKDPFTIDYFMSLDKSYIGANQYYLWNELTREYIYPTYKNFQGGLSLRKRLDMIKILDTFGCQKTLEDCQQSQSLQTDAEDVYFTIGCYKLGLPVGDDEKCSCFSLHTILKEKFFGANRLEPGYYLNLIQQYEDFCDNIYLYKNTQDIENEMLVIHKQPCGFFSNCTIRLFDIILYFNSTRKLPLFVDSSTQFEWYKFGTNMNDITYEYFHNNLDYDFNYDQSIDFREQYQYSDYKTLNFPDLIPFIKKYFSPSAKILGTIGFMESKYQIENYNNICVLFYRGNDKSTETTLPSYESILEKARTLYNQNNNIKFLIQSDESEFIEKMTQNFPNNSFYFKDEIRSINKNNNLTVDKINPERNFEYSQYYLAITIIMSKCKYVICNTGNCSLWIVLYRGDSDNVYQIR